MSEYIEREVLQNAMYHEAFETDTEMQRWDSGCWIRYKLFENVLEQQPTVDVPQWIPCSERLPEVGKQCLLTVHEIGWNCTEYNRVIIGIYSDNYKNHILAWMPLPDPWKGEKMPRYIDADALRDKLGRSFIDMDDFTFECPAEVNGMLDYAIDCVKEQPTADVRENVRGHWIDGSKDKMTFLCSECGKSFWGLKWNYCPCCGASMRGEKDVD